ncbi:MAG TPA: FAD-dependent oxidoreductase [bacterium]|nr:FAD-dependent oxidoreductase [bacterium]
MAERSNFDVGILGAGLVGCSIAYHLTRRKVSSILLDREGPGGGTSSATSAWVWVHTKAPAAYARTSLRSAERYPLLQEAIGAIEYLRTGGLAPALTEEEALAAGALADRQTAAGLEVRWLPRDEVLRREPALSPEILGATYSPLDGSVNPFLLVRRLISASRSQGATAWFHCGHVSIRALAHSFLLQSPRGEVEVRALVLAVGPWTPLIGREIGVAIPIHQVRGHVLVSEPLPPLLRHTVQGARQLVTGEVLFGHTREEAGMGREATLQQIREVARAGVRLLPPLGTARVIRAFAGIRAIPDDGLPILGAVPGVENLFIAATHSGVTLCPLIGEAMAAVVVGEPLPDDLEGYTLGRFQGAGESLGGGLAGRIRGGAVV